MSVANVAPATSTKYKSSLGRTSETVEKKRDNNQHAHPIIQYDALIFDNTLSLSPIAKKIIAVKPDKTENGINITYLPSKRAMIKMMVEYNILLLAFKQLYTFLQTYKAGKNQIAPILGKSPNNKHS